MQANEGEIKNYSKVYVNEIQNETQEDVEIYEKRINIILRKIKGFDFNTIRDFLNGIQRHCCVADDYLIGGRSSWVQAIMDCCHCNETVADSVFKEFLFEIDEKKLFSEKARNEYRAMRKCIFKYKDAYITVVNLLLLALENWICGVYNNDFNEKIMESNLKEVQGAIDADFEVEVYKLLKDELNGSTRRKNINTKDIAYGKKIVELPGEIDVLLFYNNKIFIIECKNIGLKFEPKASANEYNKFVRKDKKSFQARLDGKVKKLKENVESVLHFLSVGKEQIDYDKIEVCGVFVVKYFTDVCLIDTKGYDVVLSSQLCKWIREKTSLE